MSNIKCMKYYVTDGTIKARVHYSHFRMATTGQECVTIYARDYDRNLDRIFAGMAENNTDTMTDYFETSRVRLLPDHPLFAAALARCAR